MNSSTSRYAEKKQTQEEIKRQIALLQARLEPEPEPHTGPLVPKRKSIQSVTLATATPSPSQYDISQLYSMLTYPKPEKKRKLEHNATPQPLSRLVLESPVRSGFSAQNGFNHNRNRLN